MLFYIFLICYLQAVFEVNTELIKNTWGDEYDTYLHSENDVLLQFLKTDHFSKSAASTRFFILQIQNLPSTSFFSDLCSALKNAPSKLFIAYCSLLI